MTVALMVAVAAGVAAWVLAPLCAIVRDTAADPRRNRPATGLDPLGAPAGHALTAPDRDAGDRRARPGAQGGEA